MQVELIQSVGGVRRVPENVIRHLDAGRKRWGYLLLVDEVQTGMYRTGPFILSQTLDLTPDLLAPRQGHFGHDVPVRPDALLRRGAGHARTSAARIWRIRSRSVTATNKDTRRSSTSFAWARSWTCLARSPTRARCSPSCSPQGLASSKIVRDVRVFGLLIGIELDTRRWPQPLAPQAALGALPAQHAPPRTLPRAGGLLPV